MIVAKRFHKIPRGKFHVVELCKVKNVRFRKYWGGNVQLVTNFLQIIEKVRVGEPFILLVHKLLFNSTVCD